ncbi:hypothetical protein LCGC14_2500220, partial [marine sediment metagenome]
MAKGRVRQAVEDWYDDFDLGKRFSAWSAEKSHNVEQDVVGENDELLSIIRELKIDDPKLNAYVKKLTNPNKPAFIVFLIPLLMAFIMSIAQGIAQPFTLLFSYLVNRKLLPGRLDPIAYIQARRRGLVSEFPFFDDNRDLGFADERIDILDNATKIRPGAAELITLFRRKKITRGELDALFAEEGVDTEFTDLLLEATLILPGLNDILTLAVRDVFDKEIVDRFELSAGFPPKFQTLMEEIGVRPDIPDLLWKAHWALPGVGQAFEMRQRLRPGRGSEVFTGDDLAEYLRVADIAPFFRKPLEAISFRPIS